MANAAVAAMKGGIKRLLPRALVVRRLRPSPTDCVLLTFDDGPHPEITPAVLDRLDAYSARAVFFVVGRRVAAAPQVLAEIVRRGHRVGNHSHLHRRSYVRPGGSQVGIGTYYRDLARCQDRIASAIGVRPTLFRPPGGRLAPKTLLTSRLLGLHCVTWSRDIRDWSFRDAGQGNRGGTELVACCTKRDILLLHDNNRPILDLLDTLLPGLTARGFDLGSGVDYLL